jgi:hypothetical protein
MGLVGGGVSKNIQTLNKVRQFERSFLINRQFERSADAFGRYEVENLVVIAHEYEQRGFRLRLVAFAPALHSN